VKKPRALLRKSCQNKFEKTPERGGRLGGGVFRKPLETMKASGQTLKEMIKHKNVAPSWKEREVRGKGTRSKPCPKKTLKSSRL